MRQQLLWMWQLLLFSWVAVLSAQTIVVSEYKNKSGPAQEWTELLVVQDNVDLRGYVLTDNNAGQTARQGGVRFANVPLWQHVRRGTIIVIHHRDASTVDTDASDGFLELRAIDTNAGDYFEAIQYNHSFPWGNVALNIAQGGDILEILDAQGNHVHGLGHKPNPGSYFQSMPFPKLNHPGTCVNNGGISVNPGGSLADFTGGHNAGKTQFAFEDTQGLPNNNGANLQFWQSLRQPEWHNPSLTLQLNSQATEVTLNWNAAVDPYPNDGVQGYIILRSQQPITAHPGDGRTYDVGNTIGNAMVIATINSSQQTSYTDHLAQPLLCGDTLFYRVYAYRFGTDQQRGNGYHRARGRAYNETAFAEEFVTPQFPGTAQLQATATEICDGETAILNAMPQGTGYQYRWYHNGTMVQQTTDPAFVATTAGSYSVVVITPNGCSDTSESVAITVKPRPEVTIQPVQDQCFNTHRYDFTATVTPSDNIQYRWFFGADASVSTSTFPAPSGITFSTPGIKQVKLVVERDGCWSDTAMIQFRVIASPDVEIELEDPLLLCLGDSIKMEIRASGSNLRFHWDPPTWFSDSAAFEPWFYARKTGTYRIKVTARDTVEGCEAEDTIRVIVFPLPEASITPNGVVELCAGESVQLQASPTSSQDLYEYVWIPGGARSQHITVFQPGRYRVVVRNKTTGCQDTSDWVEVVVHPLPDTTVTVIGGKTAFCPGDTLVLEAPAGQGYRYQWNTGDTTQRLSVTQPGDYWVVVTSEKGCQRQSQVIRARYWDVQYQLSQDSIDFGALGECESEKSLAVALQNVGSDTVTVTAIVPSAFAIVPAVVAIPPGRDTVITVRFAPPAAGLYLDTITFVAAPCGVQQQLIVRGRKEQSDLQLSASTIQFPPLARCAQPFVDTVVVIYNYGTATVRFDSVMLADPFQLVSPTTFPQFRIPGDSLVLRIRFAPSTDGVFTRDIGIAYETAECQGTLVLTVSGRSVTPQIEILPLWDGVEFPLLTGCETSVDTAVTVRNAGGVPLYITATVQMPHFQVFPSLADTLQPGEERTVRIVFQPQAEGTFVDTFVVSEAVCHQQLRIPLRGVKQGVSLGVSVAEIEFPTIVFPCQPTVVDTVVQLQNTGSGTSASLVLHSVTLAQSLSVFAVDAPTGASLAPGETAAVRITFQPPGSGEWEDTVRILVQPCSIVRTVVLRGRARQAAIQPLASSFDFGTLPMGQAQTTTVLFRNTGDAPLMVTAIGGVAPPFSILSTTPPLPAVVQPQEEVAVEVQFRAVTTATRQIALFAVALPATGCTITSSSVSIRGRGRSNVVPQPIPLVLSLPQLRAQPNQEVAIPVAFRGTGVDTLGIDSIALALEYDGTLLYPAAVQPGSLTSTWSVQGVEEQPGYYRIVMTGSPLTDTAGTIAVVTARALLAPRQRTLLTIDSSSVFIAVRGNYQLQLATGAGEFILEDTCALQPEDIGWASTGGIIIHVEHPQQLRLFLPLDYRAEVMVVNTAGATVYRASLPAQSGWHRLLLPAFPAGAYWVRVIQLPYQRVLPFFVLP